MTGRTRVAAIFLFFVAAVASLVLVWHHLTGHLLPGCGPQSACASLAASPYGRILGIPLSIIGFAYFTAVTIAMVPTHWRRRRGHESSTTLTGILILGAIASAFYLGLMAWMGRWCGYCLVVHLANLLAVTAWIFGQRIANTESKSTPASKQVALTFASVFALMLVGLTLWDRQSEHQASLQQAQRLDDSVQRVLDADEESADESRGFMGRHVSGPQTAAARLVLFMDYQCGDCIELETHLNELRDRGVSMAVSLRQFPLCSERNPSIPYAWFHERACDAAQLAEAFALVGGEPAFTEAHRWLLERKAKYEPSDIDTLCQSLQLDADAVRAAMDSTQVTKILREDIETGISLGVSETPFVYLNGVELEGIGLRRTNP